MVLAVRRTKIASFTRGEAPFRRELNTPVTSDLMSFQRRDLGVVPAVTT